MTVISIKAIITNKEAMRAKYGAKGSQAIDKTLNRLVAADKKRGLTTIVFDIGDAAQMAAVGGTAVLNAADDRGAKLAVDAICDKHQPDYIMLLDGPDVVPHIALHRIPGLDAKDPDSTTDSDLPYASPAKFSKESSAYQSVTRVVGRLPAARGEQDEKKLIGLIEASISHVTRPASDFANYFAISTDTWKISTQLSLANIFGSHSNLLVSPNDSHPGIDNALARPVHFINCHGASGDSRFYGEQLGLFPIAMETPGLTAANISKGAVIAAECCFGAQLYDHTLSGAQPPICLTYLWKGACAVMGSTNVAYGPVASNGQADLITQYFLAEILKGASTGRAMLQARQTFVQNELMSNPLNLKTLAQFVLFGDPSVHPVLAPVAQTAEAKGMAAATDPLSERKMRRMTLASEGKALASAASKPGRKVRGDSPAVDRFRKLCRKRGFKSDPNVYAVSGGASFRASMKAYNQERRVAIVMEKTVRKDENGRELFTSYRAMVGQILGDSVSSVEECESR